MFPMSKRVAILSGKTWYNSAWGYRQKITVPAAKTSADLTNYPLLVKLANNTGLAHIGQENGNDVLFTADHRTKLNHEILSFSRSAVQANASWCWFGSPHAVYYNGNTYFGYVNTSGDVMIGKYTHATQTYATPVQLHAALEYDDHNQPSILIRDSDKRIIVAYSAHSGANLYLRISTNAEDISAWGAETDLDATVGDNEYCYPSLFQLTGEANDPIYLFYRGDAGVPAGTRDKSLWYTVSTDGGATWSARAHVFHNGGDERPYFVIAKTSETRLDFLVNDGHPNEVATNSVYHFYYTGGKIYLTDGTEVGNLTAGPYTPAQVTLVYSGAVNRSWVWDVGMNASNNPVGVFAYFVSTTEHHYAYAYWTGAAWVVNEVVTAGTFIGQGASEPYYSGGICLDHANTNVCYVSVVTSGVHEIYKYTTANNGVAWTTEQITYNSVFQNFRPVVPINSDPGLRVMWVCGPYFSFTTFLSHLTADPCTTRDLYAYVKIPTVYTGQATTIYLYYGNASISSQQNAAGVWTTYPLVVHGIDNTTPTEVKDSASGFDATKDAYNTPYISTGVILAAQKFAGVKANIGTQLNMAGWSAFTVEAFVNYDSAGANPHPVLASWQAAAARADVLFRINPANDNPSGNFVKEANTGVGGAFADLVVTANTWKRLAYRYDTTNGLECCLEKVWSATVYGIGSGNLDADSTNNLYIGATPHDVFQLFGGKIEELRVSNQRLSTAWLDANYDNLTAPASFITVGTEERR